MAFVRNGDVFVRDLRSGALTQVTRSNDEEALPQWGSDGGLVWRVRQRLVPLDRARRRAPGRRGQAEKDPDAKPKPDALRERQLRLIDNLRQDKAQPRCRARAGQGVAPAPIRRARRRRCTSATTSTSPTARCRPTAAGCWW